MVLYAPSSEFANRVAATRAGKVVELREAEADEETDDEYDNPPNSKKIKLEPGTGAQGSSNHVSVGANAATLSSSIGSGWVLQFNGLKLLSSVSVTAQGLVSFYNSVIDKASELLEAATPLVKQHAFTVGAVNLVLVGTDVIYWDWIITFAMAMVDSTNGSNPIQFASTIASQWGSRIPSRPNCSWMVRASFRVRRTSRSPVLKEGGAETLTITNPIY